MPAPHVLVLVGAVLLGVLLALVLARRWRRFVAGRRSRRGLRAERIAERLLRRHGFVVLDRQVEGGIELFVDGCPRTFRVRADALVARGPDVFVAEFKSGDASGTLAHRGTRRQLVEYMLAFDVERILLVDVARRAVHEVALAEPPSFRRTEAFEA
ncbi:MAG: hypothetical protein D6705_17145 [Deltaproteobacteria bacterium]|nr:MAG: hypothetical protein D6705_17145 [Deltaproteobacteria bacterium]